MSLDSRNREIPASAEELTFIERVDSLGFDSHLQLNEASGTVATDRIGSQDGTYVGSPRYDVGAIGMLNASGSSIGLDGETQYITVVDLLTGSASITISAFIQLDKIKDKHVVIAVGDGSTNGHLSLEIIEDGAGGMKFRQFTVHNGSFNIWTTDDGTCPAPGTSFHLSYVQTSDASNGKREILVNGTVVAGGTNTDVLEFTAIPSGTWYVGAYTNAAAPLDGLISELAVKNTALTAANLSILAIPTNVVYLADLDAGSVVEESFKTIDLEPYAHPSEGITPIVVSQGTLGVASVDGQELQYTASGAPTEYITTPEAHGWTGTDPVADAAAFNTAIANASANAGTSITGRGVVETVANKTYIGSCPNGSQNVSEGFVKLTGSTPNVEIRTAGKPTDATRSILKFPDWDGITGAHNRAIVLFDNCDNCRITHIQIDGNKMSVGADSDLTEELGTVIDHTEGNNGGINGIGIHGSRDCQIRFVASFDNLTDGLWIDRVDGTSTRTQDLLVENCDFRTNRRQGMSIITAGNDGIGYDQLLFRNTQFRKSGDETRSSVLIRGQKPGWGVDVEPNGVSDLLFGITFDNCKFDENEGATYSNGSIESQNVGRGITFDLKNFTTEYTRILNSQAVDNRDEAFLFFHRDGGDIDNIEIIDNEASNNGTNVIRFEGDSGAPTGTITNAEITNNDVDTIDFNANLADTGHSVEVYRGDFNPTVTTNGQTTINNNAGLP